MLQADVVPSVLQCALTIAGVQYVDEQSAVQILFSPVDVELPGPQQAQPFLWQVPHPPVVWQQHCVGSEQPGVQLRDRQNVWLEARAGVGARIE